MKPIFSWLLIPIFCAAALAIDFKPPSPPQGSVSDFYDLIRPSALRQVNALAGELRRVASVNFMAAVVMSTEPWDIDTYAKKLYETWQVGEGGKYVDRGVLLLISVMHAKVKIIAGSGVDRILTPRIVDDIEWGVTAPLTRGHFSEGLVLGAIAVSKIILTEGRRPLPVNISWRTIVIPILFLIISALILTYFSGGTFITGFGTIIGGSLGYLTLGAFGLVMGEVLGFYLSITTEAGRKKSEETEEEKKE
jgi:uncharacterized membrane protein YgcG